MPIRKNTAIRPVPVVFAFVLAIPGYLIVGVAYFATHDPVFGQPDTGQENPNDADSGLIII